MYYVFTDEDKKNILLLDKALKKNALRSEDDFRKFSEDQVVEKLKGIDSSSTGILFQLIRCAETMQSDIQLLESRTMVLETENTTLKQHIAKIVSIMKTERSMIAAELNDPTRDHDLQQISWNLGYY